MYRVAEFFITHKQSGGIPHQESRYDFFMLLGSFSDVGDCLRNNLANSKRTISVEDMQVCLGRPATRLI
jgi:hypothetical protein